MGLPRIYTACSGLPGSESRCKEVMSERCSELNSFAKNDLAELLFQKITTKEPVYLL